jgi:hypothetical protein
VVGFGATGSAADGGHRGGRRMPGYRFTIRGLSVDDDPPDPPATA